MRKRSAQDSAPSRDRIGGRQDLDRRVEDVTRRSIDEMVCTLTRQANERFLQHA
ncbi:hypothetical protein [Sphingomonas sp.]|uniref:hypothetical protein n=1 Tax=Sphingomonas sp. TaxID=28214 RepID=UPI0025FB541C|nr:hypothetical protein [Sphingomonas sp.]